MSNEELLKTYFSNRHILQSKSFRTRSSEPEGLDEKTLLVEPEKWSEFSHQTFRFPREMLRTVFDEKMLESVGIKPNQRPQEVGLNQWQELFKIYEKNHI